MDAGWDELLLTLKRESAAVGDLIILGRRKREAIRNMDLRGLQEANAHEEVRVIQLRELGEARNALLARLLRATDGAGAGTPSLREAIALMPQAVQEAAREIRQKLLDQVKELGQITQGNTELLKNAVERIDGLAQILLGGGGTPCTYRVRGGKAEKIGAAVMDREG